MRWPGWMERAVLWAEHQLAEAEAELLKLKAGAIDQRHALESQEDGDAGTFGGFDVGIGATSHVIRIYGSCWGSPALDDCDVYGYVPVPYAGHPGYAQLVYFGSVTSAGGMAVISVPTYPSGLLDYDASQATGTSVPAVAYAKIGKATYTLGRVSLDPALQVHSVVLTPAKGYQLAPAVRVTDPGTGVGAQLQAGILYSTATGTGVVSVADKPGTLGGDLYGYGTGITFDGGYDTGLRAEARAGQLISVSVNPTATSASGLAVEFTPGGTAASIHGVIANGGAATWVLDNAGDGYIGTPTVTAAAVGFFGRSAQVRASISGGALAGILVDDPGFRYTGSTLGATISGGRGEGAAVTLGTSGGSLTGTVVARGDEYYYPATPNIRVSPVSLVSGAGTIACTFNRGIDRPAITRTGDRYGCFGTSPRPINLTGVVTSAFGAIDLGGPTNAQWALGNVYDDATTPRGLVTGYYRLWWCWYRGGYVRFSTTFSGGALTAVTILDAGYGNAGTRIDYVAIPGAVVGGQGSGYAGAYSGTDYARFHFPLDANGSALPAVIDHAGSGYGTSGTQSGWIGAEPQGGEWELICNAATANDSGPTYPASNLGAAIGPTALFQPYGEIDPNTHASYVIAPARRVRAASWSLNPFAATYDFTGVSLVDGAVFQGATSRTVTYAES